MDTNEDAPFSALRKTWQPVALSRDLHAGDVSGFTLLDTEMVIARFPDGVLAADAACPHKGMRLTLGHIHDGVLQCPYHGWCFNLRGECTDIPSLVDPALKKLELAKLREYAVQERYGFIWVRMEPGTTGIPDVPEFENPAWSYVIGPPTRFKSGFRREIENYLDMTHFAFAHSGTLGKAASTKVPDIEITLHDDGFEMNAPFPALDTPHEQPGKLQQAHHRQQRCYLPNFTAIRQTFGDGDARVLLHVPAPNSRFECTVFWALAISPGFDGPEPQSQLEFAIRVLDEDRQMCENQIPREVPINPERGGWGVLVAPGDTLANTFQKTFRKFLARHAEGIS